ncbi:hypothetical protein [Micromonospora aurantiaca (nom. illeg.)]|uniref:hypothetical protein n=1 Tax=Micromonospora aurantiaca (nom. illeg.) TaxID=47850 RepID=UPI0033FC23B9
MHPQTTEQNESGDPMHAEPQPVTAGWLRYALIQMVIGYGGSQTKAAYADRRARDGADGAKERYRRRRRDAKRQFAAVQRLADALRDHAEGGAR